jgi:hypothetical protein
MRSSQVELEGGGSLSWLKVGLPFSSDAIQTATYEPDVGF